jgi:N-acetylglucosaminyldiphosphoundecaprenol N-acetyl-beta-D-mannosaminyltransferase
MSKVKLLNTQVDNLSMNEAVIAIEALINNGKFNYVVTPNVDHIVKLEEDDEFKKVYEEASLVLTDGMPLIWISKMLKTPIKEKVSGSDIFPRICKMAVEKGYKIFLLGAAEGIANKAAENLREKYPGLNIVGTYSPSYGFENKPEEIIKIISIINESQPHILAVGLGAPKQEKFIYKFKNQLKVPVSLAIGASIDFEAGNVKRAPEWMQKSGLEWFYRFVKEPRRMYKRYFKDDLKIFKLYLKYNTASKKQ